MRQTLSLIIGLLLYCTVQAKNRVIEEPPFCVRNTTSIEVSKVVLSDTATVLHIYAKYRPKYWIQISAGSYLKDNNGETYLLRSGIGITPGKEFWLPESGESEFQLVFPPLPATVTSIDFTEGDKTENGFSIWGIQLDGKKLPALVLPKAAITHSIDKNTVLPKPFIQYAKGTFKGKLLDYRVGMLQRPITLLLWESTKADVTEVPITVNSDGSFSQEVNLTSTTPCSINISGSSKNIVFFMEPGKATELYVNLREISRQQSKFHSAKKATEESIYINGPLAAIAQEMNRKTAVSNLQEIVYRNLKEIKSESFDDIKTYILRLATTNQQEIDQLPISNATRQLLTINNKIYTLIILQSAPSILTSAAIQVGKIKREDGNKYYQELQQKLPKDFMADIDLSYLNSPQSMLADMYYFPISANMQRANELAQIWGTDKGVFFDIAKTIPFYRSIKDFTPLSNEQKVAVASLPAAYREMLTACNNELLANIETNKAKTGFTVNQVGEVSNEELFASIISKFRGKTLLVDFWATWCGPCRMANKAMIPMKEKLKDKDIVYLYITGESSPLKLWENMIPDIHGEHYRLTKAQWDYLSKSFEIQGIPTYLIIDKEGNTKFRQTGFPGVSKMQEELLKVVD